jgi:hypothetical protein
VVFAPGFVNYKIGCTRLAAASDKIYQLLAHGRWFSPGIPASSTTKTGRHDIAEILLKVALNTKNQIKSRYKFRLGKFDWYFSQIPHPTMIYLFNITWVYHYTPCKQSLGGI